MSQFYENLAKEVEQINQDHNPLHTERVLEPRRPNAYEKVSARFKKYSGFIITMTTVALLIIILMILNEPAIPGGL